ncbi:4'-phosphopantetheinyl transferase superfamily protein [bacterium]|nr:4'-phosphopantetheinyl transferase superfamily protein [bacterium]
MPREGRVEHLRGLLDNGERIRADRFAFDHLRARYTISHGVLRLILGKTIERDPATLQFETGDRGKPALIDGGDVQFSLSHSGELALIAVTRGRRVGVDVEYTGRKMPEPGFVERFFSKAEIAAYTALPQDQRLDAFYAGWTRKEAYIKALGEGLARPLHSFDVSLAPNDDPPALLCVHNAPDEPARWQMRSLNPGEDYAAAVIAEHPDWTLSEFSWPETWEPR